ncbi:hypothetical protein VA7868_01938 [Vibrio aerogenes CECT 7868]|uniref:Membrane protein YhdT n=1 Tax=Vibrio aerogenes CECT 7868 TaxID=1216006 RepID=A0A1M5YS12_9VIBR|nr:YhdT family protein [Vibrio aerogenes]SHI14761.1 hypothetical protein VA7868_01938 [Vibrio aerogenes CECT 7868]
MQKRTEIYHQSQKEACWALVLSILYFIWWYVSAYGFAPAPGDQQLPQLILGLPVWFLLSCIIGPALFTLLCFLMVKFFYRDVPLDIQDGDDHE